MDRRFTGVFTPGTLEVVLVGCVCAFRHQLLDLFEIVRIDSLQEVAVKCLLLGQLWGFGILVCLFHVGESETITFFG